MTRLEDYEAGVLGDGVEEAETDLLPDGVKGMCVRSGGSSAIILSAGGIGTKAERLEILSHEACHLRLGALYRLDSSPEAIREAEGKASAASIRELLPLGYLTDALFARRLTIPEIAIEAEVSEGFVARALEWYSCFEEFEEAERGTYGRD